MNSFNKEIIKYANKLPNLIKNYQSSYFWSNITNNFDKTASKDKIHITNIHQAIKLAYRLPQEPPTLFKKSKFKVTNLVFMRLLYFLHKNRIYKLDKFKIENITALLFLHSKGLLQEYLSICNKIKTDSYMVLARHFYYSILLEKHINKIFKKKKTLKILEIGAGAGTLARVLYSRGFIDSYYIIDLPQVLLSSMITLSQSLPEETFQYNNTQQHKNESKFNFYSAQDINKIPTKYFDIIINTNSFQEMDLTKVKEYLNKIPQLAHKPTIFFSVNRRQKNLPQHIGSIDNNPLLYPYVKDKILEWGIDQMQDTIRVNSQSQLYNEVPENFSLIRISLIE